MSKRFWHNIRPNKGCETISHCIFVDCEADEVTREIDGKQYIGFKLRFGWAAEVHRGYEDRWSEPQWKRFTDLEDFWLWVMSFTYAGKKTWVWCHNASFDYAALDAFAHLIDLGWELKTAIIDAPPTLVKYRSGRKTLVLADTLNIWRMPLRKLGKLVGLEKLTMPEQWGAVEDDDFYCRRDVEIMIKGVTEWTDFLRDNDMGNFSPTAPSQSMQTFRHRYMHEKILIDADDVALDLARKCYHGGRVECGFIGHLKQAVYYLDVNSMYPFVMSYCPMPLRLRSVSHYVAVRHLDQLLSRFACCAHVTLNTLDAAFAIVRDHKLVFPVGRFDAYLCSPELRYGVTVGAIEEVHSLACYDRGVPFREFALDLYERKVTAKKAGDTVLEEQWKLLLNSFYGKWGQNGRHWVKVDTCDRHLFESRIIVNAQTLKKTVRRYFGGIVFERAEDTESRDSHPAIAAHITAEARMILWTLIRQLAPKDYFYCDTDGLLVSQNGFDQLREGLHDYTLGKLSHKATFSDVILYGPKDLVLDGKSTLKGIRKDAVELGGGKFRQRKWLSLGSLLASNSLDMPLTIDVDKTLSRTYTKGVIGADGWVTPFHL